MQYIFYIVALTEAVNDSSYKLNHISDRLKIILTYGFGKTIKSFPILIF